MKIKLNSWQTVLLFLPSLAAMLLMNIGNSNLANYFSYAAIANLLLLANLCLVIFYQTYILKHFITAANDKTKPFNAYVPVVFSCIYFFYAVYSTGVDADKKHGMYKGPIRMADYNLTEWIIVVLLLHAFVTFYFINNQFVAKRIKGVDDAMEQERLRADFLMPMKRLTKTSIWIFVICMLLSLVADIIKFSGQS